MQLEIQDYKGLVVYSSTKATQFVEYPLDTFISPFFNEIAPEALDYMVDRFKQNEYTNKSYEIMALSNELVELGLNHFNISNRTKEGIKMGIGTAAVATGFVGAVSGTIPLVTAGVLGGGGLALLSAVDRVDKTTDEKIGKRGIIDSMYTTGKFIYSGGKEDLATAPAHNIPDSVTVLAALGLTFITLYSISSSYNRDIVPLGKRAIKDVDSQRSKRLKT